MNILQKIFSVKNEKKGKKKHKIITILGLKFKFKVETKYQRLQREKYKRNLTISEKKYLITEIFKKRVGYIPNFDNPKTFNEKLQWAKLYYENPMMTLLADKYLVKEYIEKELGKQYVVPLIGAYDKAEDIDFNALPDKFVIKSNWGSGDNLIVTDKSKLDIEEVRKKLNKWMEPSSNLYYALFENCYRDIKPKIIIEEFLESLDKSAIDYKFLCFNGEPKYCWITNKYGKVKERGFYNMDWELQDIELVEEGHSVMKTPCKKPEKFDEMVCLAKKLSKDFPHVRVDFYKLNDETIRFGEMTFYTSNGINPWMPEGTDEMLGSLYNIESIKNRNL